MSEQVGGWGVGSFIENRVRGCVSKEEEAGEGSTGAARISARRGGGAANFFGGGGGGNAHQENNINI